MVTNVKNAFAHGMNDKRDMRPLEPLKPQEPSHVETRATAQGRGYVMPRTRRVGIFITDELFLAWKRVAAENGISQTALLESAMSAAFLDGGVDLELARQYDEKI